MTSLKDFFAIPSEPIVALYLIAIAICLIPIFAGSNIAGYEVPRLPSGKRWAAFGVGSLFLVTALGLGVPIIPPPDSEVARLSRLPCEEKSPDMSGAILSLADLAFVHTTTPSVVRGHYFNIGFNLHGPEDFKFLSCVRMRMYDGSGQFVEEPHRVRIVGQDGVYQLPIPIGIEAGDYRVDVKLSKYEIARLGWSDEPSTYSNYGQTFSVRVN